MTRFPSTALAPILAALLAASLAGCGPEPGAATTASLGRAWAASAGLELVPGGAWDLAETLAGPGFDAAPGTGVRVVVGLPDDPAVADLLARLPVEMPAAGEERRGRFRCLERAYLWREAVVVATIEDPARAGRPLVLATSRHEARAVAAARAALDGPAPWRPRLRVVERGEVQLEVRLSARGAARVDTVVDHAARRRWDELGEVWETDEGWSWRPAPGRVALVSWESGLREALPRLAWAGVEAPARMEVLVVPTVDALVGIGPAQRGARYDPGEHRLVWGWPATDGPLALAEGLLVAELGAPAIRWLARVAATEASLPGGRLLAACADLVGAPRPLDELLDPGAPARSGRALDLQRALLWRVAREELGDDDLPGLWTDPSGLAGLASAWDDALQRVEELRPTFFDVGPEPAELPAAGVLVELPVAATGGPGSRACFAALERARDAGADAVLLRVHVAPSAAGEDVHALEGDAAVLWAVLMARTFDLEVALSAEVLASPSGAAEGERVLTRDAEWRASFDWTARAVEHVALLAREAGAAALVLNGGAPEAVRTAVEPDLDAGVQRVRRLRDEGWRAVLRAARSSFDGDVVLACAQPEDVGFLDELDAVLVELVPAAPESLPADGRRLVEVLDARVERVLGAHPRTMLEVGFRARENGAADPEAQRARFAALAEALERRAARGAARPAGVWVRGLGSAPGEADPGGFGIAGRPAEVLLPALWR